MCGFGLGFRGHHCFGGLRNFWSGMRGFHGPRGFHGGHDFWGHHGGHHIGRRAFLGGFGGTVLGNALCNIFPGLGGRAAFNSGYDLGLYNGIGIGMNQGVGIGYNAGQYNGLIQGLISNPLIGGWLS